MGEVDLSRLADGYRHRNPSQASRARAASAGESLGAGSLILDVGGGPGFHAAVWAEQGHHPIILDPEPAMTAPARDAGLAVVHGIAQALPFRDRSFDLVWFHFSLHYGDWRRALDEALRVIRPGAHIEIWTLAADHHDASMLARWFPSVPAIDRDRFPEATAVESYLADRAGSVSRTGAVEHKVRSAGEWASAAESGFVSTLQLIDPAELEAGLAAFRAAYPDPSATVDYELRLNRITASGRL